MHTNIERAINDLILSNGDIALANAIPAYLREAGFEKMSPDALVAFEHALDKYPTRRDDSESRAAFVKGISRITREYWSSKPEMVAEIRHTHCDACAHRLFDLRERGCEHVEEVMVEERARKRHSKSRKGRRRLCAKRDVATARFDPYAPSTSTVIL